MLIHHFILLLALGFFTLFAAADVFGTWLIKRERQKALRCEHCDNGEKLKDDVHINAHGIPHAICQKSPYMLRTTR